MSTGLPRNLPEDLPNRLIALGVWAVSIADHNADTLTPRQTAVLYEANRSMREAADRLQRRPEPINWWERVKMQRLMDRVLGRKKP